MKKILSLALVLAMMLTMSVTAFASEIKQDSENKTGSTNITHTVSESYVVTIPDSMTVGTEATISVKDVVLEKGYYLAVSVSSTQYDNGWKLKNNDETLGYTLKIDGKDVANNGIVLTAGSRVEDSQKLVASLNGTVIYSGDYRDELTFTVTKKQSSQIDGRSLEPEKLKTDVVQALGSGERNLSITLESDAGASMTQAIGQGMIEARVEKSSVNLTLNGLETLPDFAFYESGENLKVYGEGLKTLSLPDATSIGNFSLQGSGLVNISAPNVTSVGKSAIMGCENLTFLDMPELETVGIKAFCNCFKIASVSFPKVTEVGEEAFNGCVGLTSVSLPKATNIGYMAFFVCPIKSLTLTAEGEITLGTSALYNPGNIDLVLNENKETEEIKNSKKWNGYTFKSIEFVSTTN